MHAYLAASNDFGALAARTLVPLGPEPVPGPRMDDRTDLT
jgi:hypothetical protein